jgi:hypothetical protein
MKIVAFAWNTVEGEGWQFFTRAGKVIQGSLLLVQASAHIYAEKEKNLSARMKIWRFVSMSLQLLLRKRAHWALERRALSPLIQGLY